MSLELHANNLSNGLLMVQDDGIIKGGAMTWKCLLRYWPVFFFLYPHPTKLEGGILDSPCPSVCPSVCLPVDDMVSGA